MNCLYRSTDNGTAELEPGWCGLSER